MDDKAIKRALKDASLYLSDAAKAWPKHPNVAVVRLEAALSILDSVYDYVERPMGGREGGRK